MLRKESLRNLWTAQLAFAAGGVADGSPDPHVRSSDSIHNTGTKCVNP